MPKSTKPPDTAASPLKLSPGGRRYGYLKDKADTRDYDVYYAPFVRADEPSWSNAPYLGPVLDQGQEGSCTAHAGCANREFLHWKELARRGQPVAPGTDGLYSPAFLYYIERQIDGTLDQGDCGSYGRTACQAMAQYGIAPRVIEPYTPGDFSTPPSADDLAAALEWKSGGYHRLDTLVKMKSAVASGWCFMIGFTVYQSFESIDSTGIWTPDSATEGVLGGHETLVFGYDDTVNGGSFAVRNSWGASWGQNGNFWLRYSDAMDPAVLQDAWLQHLGHWGSGTLDSVV